MKTKYHFMATMVVFLMTVSTLADISFKGTIVDSSNGKGISGVLVSLENTNFRTTSKNDGSFSLKIPEIAARQRRTIRRSEMIRIVATSQGIMLDLSNSQNIRRIVMYQMDGRRIFLRDISPGDKTIKLPNSVPQLVLMKIIEKNGEVISRNIIYGRRVNKQIFMTGSVRYDTEASTEGKTVRIFFKHDGYYHYTYAIGKTKKGAEIRLVPDPKAYVFDPSVVHRFEFTINKKDSLAMEREALKEAYVPAMMSFDSKPFGKVGIRYKGSDYYSMPRCFDEEGNRSDFPECENISLKVRFNKYSDTAHFYNMKKLNFHSMGYDETKLKEMLAYKVFRDMGVYTSRTSFVKIVVNGVPRGLFTAVENIDGRFTKSRWPEYGDGNLYKERWPWKNDESYYRDGLVTNEKPDDSASVKKMIKLYKAIQSATPETFIEKTQKFIDIDYWLRYIIVNQSINAWDGIMRWRKHSDTISNHNYFIYEEENEDGKIWLIPWDLNDTYDRYNALNEYYGIPDWNVQAESCDPVQVWGTPIIPPNCDMLTGLIAGSQEENYVKIGEEYLSTIFTPKKLKAQVNQLAEIIDTVMSEWYTEGYGKWKKGIASMLETMDSLPKRFDNCIHKRTPTIDTAGYLADFPPDSGFRMDRVNNFEFDPTSEIDSWCSAFSSDTTITFSMGVNTVKPLWGKADLECSFKVHQLDTSRRWSEWTAIRLGFDGEVDLTSLSSIRFSAASDIMRYCRVIPESPLYAEMEIPMEAWYCWQIPVGKCTRENELYLKDLTYSDMVPEDLPDVKDMVMNQVTGLYFVILPRYENNGTLEYNPDSGFIRIDNITFKQEN